MKFLKGARDSLFGSRQKPSQVDARLPGPGERVAELLDANQPVTPDMLLEAQNVYHQLILGEFGRLRRSLDGIINNSQALGIAQSEATVARSIWQSLGTKLSSATNTLPTRVPQPLVEVLVAETNTMRIRLEKLQGIQVDIDTAKDPQKVQQAMMDILY